MILLKLNQCGSAILKSGTYQAGSKEVRSTQEAITYVMWLVVKQHISMAFIAFRKAFDNLKRSQMCNFMRKVAESEGIKVAHCVKLIVSLLQG